MTVADVAAGTPAEKRALLQRLLEQQSSFPLSAGQQWLWYLQQLAPDSAAYHFPYALRITSRIDLAAMRSALQALINRHAAFRTVFSERDGAIVQRVQADALVSFTVTDVGGMDAATISSLIAQESDSAIKLETGPVFRAHLFRESDTSSVLLLVWHHIVLDGWSIALVLEELGVLYAAYVAEQPWQLTPTVPYREFVEWQGRMLASDEGQRHARYWQAQMRLVQPLDIATDFQRPTHRSYRGGSVPFALDESVTSALHAVAAGENTTPFVVLLACFQGLLHRITGHEQIPVSYPVNGRTESRFARTAGFFINQLPAVATINADTTFRELIAATKAEVIAALEHQDYHLSLLPQMQGAQASGSPWRSPDAMFVLQKSQGFQLELPRGAVREHGLSDDRHIASRGELGGLQVESFALESTTARFDLEIQMLESGGALLGVLQYDAEIFGVELARMFTACFQRLVSEVVGNTGIRVSTVDMLGAVEQRRVLTEWNATERHWPDERGIADVFERVVVSRANAVAACCGDHQLTFGELDARANRIAHWLRRAGVRPQEIVGVAIPRSLDMLIAMLGIIKAGSMYLPLDPSNPAERLNFMLSDSGARFVITSDETCTHFRRSPAQQLCMHCDEERIRASSATRVQRDDTPLLYVLYTSGSTGLPKGVSGTVRGALNRMHWMWKTLPFGDGEVCAQLTTPGFVDAVWEIFGPLLRGVPIVIIRDDDVRDTERLVHALETSGASRITLVPSLLRVLLDREDVSWRLRRLHFWSCSGEAMDRTLAQRFRERLPGARLFNLYGCSEASADSAWFEIEPDWRGERVPIGKPIANTQILLLDRYGNLVPPGVVGEIHIGGAGLASGYLKRPDLSAERWMESSLVSEKRLYRTGDLGRQRADGAIEYFGRADHQLKIRGNRVETAEVEHALRRHPDVGDVAVAGMMEPSGDQALVAYIVPSVYASGDRASHDERPTDTTLHAQLRTQLRAYLGTLVPAYMVPSHWVQLDTMPLTASGKINRRALPKPGSAERSSEYVAPRTDTERQLAHIWQETLEVRRLGIHDDFFEWGGHSILAVQTMSRVSKHFDRSLPVAMLFQFPTVAGFAQQLDREVREHSRHEVVAIDASSDGIPLFWIPGGAALPYFTRLKELASHLGPERSLHGVGTRLAEHMSEVESVPVRALAYAAALRGVQPRGPYYIAGFCLGGVMAFEVAQQLEAQGEHVAFLALVNTWMPAGSISRGHWLQLFMQRAVYHVRFALRSPTVDTRQYLRQRATSLRRLLRRPEQARAEWSAATGELAPTDAPSEDAVLRATVHLASSYEPQQYSGKVHVFLSEEPDLVGVSARLDPRLSWRRVCGQVEVFPLHGGHDAMLDVPLVEEFGAALRSALGSVAQAAQRG